MTAVVFDTIDIEIENVRRVIADFVQEIFGFFVARGFFAVFDIIVDFVGIDGVGDDAGDSFGVFGVLINRCLTEQHEADVGDDDGDGQTGCHNDDDNAHAQRCPTAFGVVDGVKIIIVERILFPAAEFELLFDRIRNVEVDEQRDRRADGFVAEIRDKSCDEIGGEKGNAVAGQGVDHFSVKSADSGAVGNPGDDAAQHTADESDDDYIEQNHGPFFEIAALAEHDRHNGNEDI